ncbi:unnamed protein product [Chrysodeixis includens]|uniref:Uncharacterized protein n=1 Tax=Chrysodeixis includens TaxID=689277 RepID=A0A9N8Q0D2_CHRIL|nr:unnamed protein product [Chrysodeixis includens]
MSNDLQCHCKRGRSGITGTKDSRALHGAPVTSTNPGPHQQRKPNLLTMEIRYLTSECTESDPWHPYAMVISPLCPRHKAGAASPLQPWLCSFCYKRQKLKPCTKTTVTV